jgi:TonB family protein
MPADFLRDVVRPPQSKRSRVWSMVPLSIAAHALGGLAFFIIPLAAEEEPPPPAALARVLNIMTARPIPPPPAAVRPPSSSVPRDTGAAPSVIPDEIAVEREVAPSGTGDTPAIGSVSFGEGVIGSVNLGERVVAPTPPPPPVQERKPVRPGGDIREPQKIRHVPPIYPQIAISAGVQGIVILEATISEAGTIENLRVLKSHPLLERAAIEAVKQWRYTPTRLNGVPVPIIMTVTVNFMLQR